MWGCGDFWLVTFEVLIRMKHWFSGTSADRHIATSSHLHIKRLLLVLLWTGSSFFSWGQPAVVYTTANSGLPDNSVSALAYDAPRGRLWVGTDYGLARLDVGSGVWTVWHAAAGGLPGDAIRAVAVGPGGEVWVGTFFSGLARFDGTGWTVWDTRNSGLPADQVRTLAVEPGGGVWVGTVSGLAHLGAGGAWQVWNPANSGLTSGNIGALARAADGTVWAGTVNGGLARWRAGSLRVYSARMDNLPDNTILALALDTLARPVMGTAAAGLVRYLTDSTWGAYGPQNSGNPASTVQALAQDSAGRWWLGTEQAGLVGWEAGRWHPFGFGSAAGLPDSTVRALAVGAGGDLWVGLRSGGVARWRPGPLGTGEERGADGGVEVWPNPAVGGWFRVRVAGKDVPVVVVDALGREVWRGVTRGGEVEAELGRAGVYGVRVGRRVVRVVGNGE